MTTDRERARTLVEIKDLADLTPYLGRYIFYRRHDARWAEDTWREGLGYLETDLRPFQNVGKGHPITKAISERGVHSIGAFAPGYLEEGNRMQVRLATRKEIMGMTLSYGRTPSTVVGEP